MMRIPTWLRSELDTIGRQVLSGDIGRDEAAELIADLIADGDENLAHQVIAGFSRRLPQRRQNQADTGGNKEVPMITLSYARPGDEAAIAALCAELDEFYGSLPQGLPAERAEQVRDVLFGDPPLAHALVAWDGEAPAGFAAYSFLWPAAGLTTSLYLKELYVAEAHRRTGVGRLLMDGLYDVARRRGLSRVEWTTDTSNVGAQAFYKSLGARPLASKIFYRAAP